MATCNDRLKVDNILKLFSVTGESLLTIDYSHSKLFDVIYIQMNKQSEDIKYFNTKEEGEKKVGRRLLNLKVDENLLNGIQRESEEIKFISSDYIVQKNQQIKEHQKSIEEEKELRMQKQKKNTKTLVLVKGENFGMAKQKPIVEKEEQEIKELNPESNKLNKKKKQKKEKFSEQTKSEKTEKTLEETVLENNEQAENLK